MNSVVRPAALAEFPALFALPIQWGDQDAFQHVNNVVYLRWFESVRIIYLEQSGLDPLLAGHGLGPILANLSCNYRKQLLYPDRVTIGARVTRLGRTSLAMQHAVYSDRLQAVAAEGESIVVLFDYQAQKPFPIPDDVRQAVNRFEQTTGNTPQAADLSAAPSVPGSSPGRN